MGGPPTGRPFYCASIVRAIFWLDAPGRGTLVGPNEPIESMTIQEHRFDHLQQRGSQ